MTPEQEHFFELLDAAPTHISALWNRERLELNMEGMESSLPHLSHGERCLAQFLAGIWLGDSSRFGFDVIEAVKVFDGKHRALIASWLAAPFYP